MGARRQPAKKHSRIHQWVRENFDEDLWTYAEVADHLGKSVYALRRWVREGYLDPPSKMVSMGDNSIYLFTQEDVDRFSEYSRVLRSGRRTDAYTAVLKAVGKSHLDKEGST